MNRGKAPISIRHWFFVIISGLGTILLVFQLFFQQYYVSYVEKIYQSNMAFVLEQTALEVQNTFAGMNDVVTNIAEAAIVKSYANTEKTEDRYFLAYNHVQPFVAITTKNMQFDHLLISDMTGAWHRFTGGLSNASAQKIREQVASTWEISNRMVTLEGRTYFCTTKPIVTIEQGMPIQIGMVVALTNVDKIRGFLKSYGQFQEISIVLHDFKSILVSTSPELEEVLLENFESDSGSFLRRAQTILPESLGVIISIPYSKIFPNKTFMILSLFAILVCSALMLLLMALFVNRLVIRPFTHVIADTHLLGDRDLGQRISSTGVKHVDNLVESINSMLNRLEDYSRRVFLTQQNLYEMELSHQETEMYLLRNQINRHFLYNSLTSLKTLADRGESEKVEAIASGIAQLLHYTTSQKTEANLFDEMEIVYKYITIQNIRFDNRITMEIDIDDRLCEYKIIKLLIQPLVENALIHGLESKEAGCKLYLRGYLKEDKVYIEVEDNGAGISKEQLAQIQEQMEGIKQTKMHMGLEGVALLNIQKRISLAYGEPYGLELESEEGKYSLARLTLPAIPDTLE